MTKVLLLITGGIAAYKSLQLIRLLKQQGYDVHPLMTNAACKFITPLCVSTLAQNPVATDMFSTTENTELTHLTLSRHADILCIAPCSANFMAKITHGIADDLASTTILGTNTPLLIAPAMNPTMWHNPATQANVKILQKRNITILDPTLGETICGEIGIGRMREPEDIQRHIKKMLFKNSPKTHNPLRDKHYLVTVGATLEYIDPVRVITNLSSGKQGFAIVQSLLDKGAKVTVVAGNVTAKYPARAHIKKVETAEEMLAECKKTLPVNGAIFCAAVADYKVVDPKAQKLKKEHDTLTINLKKNPDILQQIANHKKRPEIVIGFAAETENLIENATKKLHEKGCDMIVANTITKQHITSDTTHAYIIDKEHKTKLGTVSKIDVALAIVQYIENTSQNI